jgi:hypothetical protein
LLSRVPLGQPPSLHSLRRRLPSFVRGLRRYYGAVRLPMAVHHRITSLDFPLRPGPHPFATRQPWDLPILARDVSGRAWGLGPRRVRPGLAFSPRAIVPSATPRASAPWSGGISRLDTQPARTPANASPDALRLPAHDSGPVWIATPSPYDSFIHYIPSIFIGAPAKAGIQLFQSRPWRDGPRRLPWT